MIYYAKVYVIMQVNGLSEERCKDIIDILHDHPAFKGLDFYVPARDNKMGDPKSIYYCNEYFMDSCPFAILFYNGESKGTHYDIGYLRAKGKKIFMMSCDNINEEWAGWLAECTETLRRVKV